MCSEGHGCICKNGSLCPRGEQNDVGSVSLSTPKKKIISSMAVFLLERVRYKFNEDGYSSDGY